MRGAVLPRPRLAVRAGQAPDLSLGRRTHRAGTGGQRGEAFESRVGRVPTRRLLGGIRCATPALRALLAECRGDRGAPFLDETRVVRVGKELPHEGVALLV